MNKIIHGIEVDNDNYIALFNLFVNDSKMKNETYKKELFTVLQGCKLIKTKSGRVVDASCNLYSILGPNPKSSDIKKVKDIIELVFSNQSANKQAFENEFLLEQFGYGVDIIPGYNLSLPKSTDEIIDLIITYGKIIDSNKLDRNVIMKYGIIMKNIQSKIAEFAKNTYLLEEQSKLVMNNMKSMLNSIKKSKDISFDEEEFFYQVLDHHIKVTLTGDDGEKFEVDEVSTSSFVKEYKEEYEKELVEFNKQREIQKYFKKVNKKTLNNISFKDFPSYDDPNFLDFMYKILDLLEESNNPEIYAVASLKIIHYYHDDSVNKDKVK